MPYTKKESRVPLQLSLSVLAQTIENEGDLNYAMTCLVLSFVKKKGLSYSTISTVSGTIHLVGKEFEDRVVSPYESLKQMKNGDLPEYAELIKKILDES